MKKLLLLFSFLFSLGISADDSFVDLGLPSGLLWATCNLGASEPEDAGHYYAWGEISPKTFFSKSDYKYKDYPIGLSIGQTNISGTEYDAATVALGGTWRMPTKEELKELAEKCSRTQTTRNGKVCMELTGPNGNKLIIARGGFGEQGTTHEDGYGLWTSTQNKNNYATAYRAWEWTKISVSYTWQGLPIRPVTSQKPTDASNDIAINEENFPDENFRAFLKEQPYGQDGIITKKEINTITKIDVSYKEIKSLEGVEFFTILDNLNCYNNQLASLDVSKNTALKELTCGGNLLTSLDVSNNLALKSLYCGGNLLTSLDVSKNMALTWLACYANQLTSLDVSNNTALMHLDCYNNQLASLDVSKNTALGELNCGGNQLTSLDVSKNSALKNLYCTNNLLTSLDVSKNTSLTSLSCYCNHIKGETMNDLVSTLPIQNKALLRIIELNNSQEGNICTKDQVKIAKERGWRVIASSWDDYEGHDPLRDVIINDENFPDENFRTFLKEQPYGVDGIIIDDEINFITEIVVSQKEIKSLKGIEFFTKLKSLYCGGNLLTSLDVSKNMALTWLECIYNNQMTSLDVSKNTALTWLDCKHNQLTNLDVSGCTDLRTLDCSNNKIANLDLSISNNTALTFLYCYGNKIKGEAMDALVESLPNQSSAKITVIDLSNSSEENVCTTIQVNTAKEKGWKVYSHNLVNIYGNIYTSEVEYEGSDPSGIQNITLNKDTKTPVYNLNGMKLLEPRKGINIVGGKKVLVK